MTFDLTYTLWRFGRLDSDPHRDQWIAISAHASGQLAKAAGARLSKGHPRPEKLKVTYPDGTTYRTDYTPGCGLTWKLVEAKSDHAETEECHP